MKNFYIKSLGCKQNQLESQIIQDILIKAGYRETNKIQTADIYILNSCTVTSHSDSSARYFLKQAKKQNPKIRTILLGCLAQTHKQHKNFDYSIADLVLGNSEKMNILDYIENKGFFAEDIFKNNSFQNKFLYNPTSTRVSVKIQDGCNNRCSYCIIPYARGNSRSNSIENIINQINLLVDKEIKEIVLTGIHIGQWGLEFDKKLIDLLKEIEKTKLHRYRLGSLYINELDPELIDFLKNSKKFCPHFHLSLQSLCDKTLKDMNRNYSAQDALDLISILHKNFNLPYLGADIIAGFPLESDEDFNTTYENLKKAKLSKIHCFPYSKRENTKAYSMVQVPDYIKKQRTQKVIDLSDELYKDFLQKNKNTSAEILIQKKSPKTGLYSAITRNYIKIQIKDDDPNLRHTLKTVDLNEFELM